MSLVIADISLGSALVAVDTASSSASGDNTPGEACKLLPIPNLSAVLAVAGNMALLTRAFQLVCAIGGNFDFACNAIVEGRLVDSAMRLVEAQDAAREKFEVRERQLLIIVGWSPAQKRVRGLVAERVTRQDGFKIMEFGHLISPPVPGLDILPDSIENIHELARRQVAHVRETIPGCPIGGRLVVCEITRGRITIDTSRILS